jgi:hypothetical protein
LVIKQAEGRGFLDLHRDATGVGGDAEEVPVAGAAGRSFAMRDEAVADAKAPAEGVATHLPVAAAKLKGHGLALHILSDGGVRVGIPEGPEVDVLDAAHVEVLTDEDAAMQHIAIHVADEMPSGDSMTEVDALVAVGEEDILHRAVVRACRR